MSLQELSDRFEIKQLITRYSNALDTRRFELLDEVFTPDAYIDYRATGGIDGRYPQIRAWLPPAVTHFPHMCHLVGNIGLNPVEVPLPASGRQVMFLAMWYRDELIRTPGGWRMSERVQQGCIQHNVPRHLQIPDAGDGRIAKENTVC
jgi:hypothetical protein